jgi:hypothetical protein
MPGNGVRLTRTSAGFSYSAITRGPALRHPFKPFLSHGGVRLSRGLVEYIEPKIKGVPIGGTDDEPPPVLKLAPEMANDAGESWVCVELTLNADGKLPAKDPQVIIAHRKELVSHSRVLARCGLAMILWRDKKPFRALEVVYFNLRYQRLLPPDGAGEVRHIFY